MKPTHILLSVGVLCFSSSAFAQSFLVTKGAGQVGKNPKSYQPAVVKQSYPVGWWAKTGGSRLDIQFSPGNDFILLPGSEAEISDRTDRGGSGLQRKVSLKTGKVVMELNGRDSKNIQVETPTAICGAVGTVFEVNAATSDFNITKGAIYLIATKDSSFHGTEIHGNISLDPGKENTSVSGTVSGKFAVNGARVVATNAKIDLAKAVGNPSEAALEVPKAMKTNAVWEITTEPTVPGGAVPAVQKTSTIPAGSYLMAANSTKLRKVTSPERKALHRNYREAARTEGSLAVEQKMYQAAKRPVPGGLNGRVNAAAKRASALRKELFNQRVMRNVARETVRTITR